MEKTLKCIVCNSLDIKKDSLGKIYNICNKCLNEKISKSHRGLSYNIGRPSKLKGRKLSEERCLKISLGKLGKKRLPFSLEWRNKLGLVHKGIKKTYQQNLKNSLAHKGKIPNSYNKRFIYNNRYFRSSWEINFAKWCDKNKIQYLYEPVNFNLGEINYIPDFFLPTWNIWVEIKGHYTELCKKKIKLFKEKISNNLWVIDITNYGFLDSKWMKYHIMNNYNPTYDEYLLEEGNNI
jgi:hypothetical protein